MFVEEHLAMLAGDSRPLVEVLDRSGQVARTHSYRQVVAEARALSRRLPGRSASGGPPVVGVVTANSPEFLVADFALLRSGAVEVPVPLAFSAEQAASLLEGVDACLVDDAGLRRLDEWTVAAVLPPGCP